MSQPQYAIEISNSRSKGCLDCNRQTSPVTGTRNGIPVCDVCLLEQEPRLGALIALHACVTTLADAVKPRRAAQGYVFELVCEHGRNLESWLRRGWRSALDAEMRLITQYDLRRVQERARALGGPVAERQFEDLEWVRATIRKAKRQRVNVRGCLRLRRSSAPVERSVARQGSRSRGALTCQPRRSTSRAGSLIVESNKDDSIQ
jgi:hypothetical protein